MTKSEKDVYKVADSGFRQEDFDLVAGQTKYKLDRVAPGANASHTVVVRPKKFGYFNFTAAEVLEGDICTMLVRVPNLKRHKKNWEKAVRLTARVDPPSPLPKRSGKWQIFSTSCHIWGYFAVLYGT